MIHEKALILADFSVARHTFTTISHVAAEMKRGAKVESLHITMVDIHAATQARFIIVMALLQQILDNIGTDAGQKKEHEIDLYSAVFFVYTSVAMPDTCCDLWVHDLRLLCIITDRDAAFVE